MRKQNEHSNKAIRLAGLLLCLVLVSTYFTSGLLARYTTTSEGEDAARVAVMAMDTSYVIENPISIAPGEDKTIEITLTNKKNNRICEVAQNYSMTVENITNNMELSFKYFLVSGAGNINEDSVSGTFKAGVEETVTYKIKIAWTGNPRPASSAFEVDGLKIVIKAEQVD